MPCINKEEVKKDEQGNTYLAGDIVSEQTREDSLRTKAGSLLKEANAMSEE